MIPSNLGQDQTDIKDAYKNFLEANANLLVINRLRDEVESFIINHKDDFTDIRSYLTAKSILTTIADDEEMLSIVNKITDISNLLDEPGKWSHEVEEIIGTSELIISVEAIEEYLKTAEVIINEKDGATYYDLRQFVTMIYKNSHDRNLKDMLTDLLVALSSMEVRNIPIPNIKRLKSISPLLFP